MPTTNNTAEINFRCTVQYMFKGCPKQDGWFGCFAIMKGGVKIRLTGKTMLPLTKGMQLDVTAVQKSDDEFAASDITILTKTITGTKAYLASLHNVSDLVAEKLVHEFGSDAIDVIRTDPDRVKTKLGLKDKQIKAIVEGVTNTDEINQIRLFLPELFTDAVNYIKKNIPMPKQTIQTNPWILLDCPHTSFQVVDTIAVRLGVNPSSQDRIEQGIKHILESDQTGNEYMDISDDDVFMSFMAKTESLLRIRFGGGMSEFGKRLIFMSQKTDSEIHIRQYKNRFQLYTKKDWNDYLSVLDFINNTKAVSYISTAEQAKRLKNVISQYNSTAAVSFTDEQLYATTISLSKRISVITGGPGRGKTVTVGGIAECNKQMPQIMDPANTGREGRVLLLAPTGRAVKKIKDDTGDKFMTMTIDKLICSVEHELEENDPNKKKKGFMAYNRSDTLIIIDESSMIDMPKIAALFLYFDKARYCFVGDKDQLPPVGRGQFFRDIIACKKVAVSHLTVPLRNNGLILQNADKINTGDIALQYDLHEMPLFPQAEDDQTAIDFIIDQYNDERINEPDVSQIAIICPTKKGYIGVISINVSLQNILCPENQYGIAAYNAARQYNIFSTKGFPIPDTHYGYAQTYTKFRVGDTVMCTKSNYKVKLYEYENNDFWNGKEKDESQGIFNGDIGKIIGYVSAHAVGNDSDSDFIIVQFNDGKVASLDRSNEEFDNFTLGYAITVHKAQGCEYNTVIYISQKSLLGLTAIGFACRNLAYTAITRAKKRVVIIGSKESLNACIQTEMPQRNSTLAEEIV